MSEGLHDGVSDDEVRRRAYERYLARGAGPGGDLDDWLAAERELRAGRARNAVPSVPPDAA